MHLHHQATCRRRGGPVLPSNSLSRGQLQGLTCSERPCPWQQLEVQSQQLCHRECSNMHACMHACLTSVPDLLQRL